MFRSWVCAHIQGGHVYTGNMWVQGDLDKRLRQTNWVCGRCRFLIQSGWEEMQE